MTIAIAWVVVWLAGLVFMLGVLAGLWRNRKRVSKMPDRSGNGNDAVQTNRSNQPWYGDGK